MTLMRALTLLIAAATLFASEAEALETWEANRGEEEADIQHDLSVTISPLHLSVPLAEATVEWRIGGDLGAALIAGAGAKSGVGLYEIGGQFNYYLVGWFIHGMQVGVEILHAGGAASSRGATVFGAGLALGPYVGYKIATNVGFTFVAQAGGYYALVGARSGNSTASGQAIGLLLNLNLGWSFDL